MADADRKAFDKWARERDIPDQSVQRILLYAAWRGAIDYATKKAAKEKRRSGQLSGNPGSLDAAPLSPTAVDDKETAYIGGKDPPADLAERAARYWREKDSQMQDVHFPDLLAAFAADYAAERIAEKEKALKATLQAEDNVRNHLAKWQSRAEVAEKELAKIREVLRDIDYASLPDDYPVSEIAQARMTTLNERTKQGLAEIGRYEAAEQALAEEREACAKVADEKAANSVFLSETASEDISPLHGAAAEAAISIAATIRARKGGEETS
ncbi:hypothetical protein ACUSIJ_24675 [Pseudochelatococcus sp. B33]